MLCSGKRCHGESGESRASCRDSSEKVSGPRICEGVFGYTKKKLRFSKYKKCETERDLSMKYVCDVCGWVYDEEAGYPEGGIAPGTKWEDVPEDFVCPLCFVGKEQFSPQS